MSGTTQQQQAAKTRQTSRREKIVPVYSQDVLHTMRSGQASNCSQDTKVELREIYTNVRLDRSPLFTVTKVEPSENFVHKPVTVTKSMAANLNYLPSPRLPLGSHDEDSFS